MHVTQAENDASIPQIEPTTTKVIVAEDHPAMRRMIANVLRRVGYDVVEVGDGATLWEEMHAGLLDEDNPRPADLVISDVRMPGFSGLEALGLIRAMSWATPVILMTAFGDQDTHAEASRLGAVKVFNKPFDVKELLAEALRLVDPR